MNIFRLFGDLSHLASFFFLIYQLYTKKNTLGISLKTQELYLIVFVARYLDLFSSFISVYNTLMKIFYIAASAAVVYMMRYQNPWKKSYSEQRKADNFLHLQYLVLPCAVLALILNEGNFGEHWHGILHYIWEVIWSFSIWLEAVAILPQLNLLRQKGEAENITAYYVVSLGLYRGLYIVNWIYR